MWGNGSCRCRGASATLAQAAAGRTAGPTPHALSRRSSPSHAFTRFRSAAAASAAVRQWSQSPIRCYSDAAGPAAPSIARGGAERIERPSIDPEEVARFAAVADQWWDPYGSYAKLQLLNRVRFLPYVSYLTPTPHTAYR